MRAPLLMLVALVGCEGPVVKSERFVLTDDGPVADSIRVSMTGFSRTTYEMDVDLVGWTVTGWHVAPQDAVLVRHAILEPTPLPEDLQVGLATALAQTSLLELSGCGNSDIVYDGDFPSIQVDGRSYSTYPSACDAIAVMGENPFALVVEAFPILDPQLEEVVWHGNAYVPIEPSGS